MKLEEDAWRQQQQQQQQQVVPIARKDDGNPGSAGKGDASRETRPAVGAGHTDATDTATERKKAAGKTVKVSVLSDGSPKSVLKNANNCAGRRSNAGGREMEIPPPNLTEERLETLTSQPLRNVTQATKTQEDDAGVTVTRRDEDKPRGSDVHGEGDHVDDESGGDHVDDDDADAGDHHENEDEDDDDDADSSVTLSGDCESHFITTHEIQLLELSDEEDEGRDVEAGSLSEEDGPVYAFVDYASFVDTDADVDVRAARRGGATDGVGSDLPKTPKCGGNDQPGGAQLHHLSIKTTTSRAINDPSSSSSSSIQDKQGGDSGGGKTSLLDGAKCVIAAPDARLHVGRALTGREAAGWCWCCSSGSSARSSEPDDADKEVRHLTGRAFKSLAYPACLGAIRAFSGSSESCATSERGLSRWSALVDLKYGTLATDRPVAARRKPTAPSTDHDVMNNNNNARGYRGVIGNNMFTLKKSNNNNNNHNHHGDSPARNVELLRGNFGHFTLTETLNFRCNVESRVSGGGGGGGAGEVTARRQKRSGGAATPCNAERATMEVTHKKAMFASSILKNVISKKMQFEEERKMERGEICERQRGVDGGGGKGPREPQRQRGSRFSEAGSDNTIVCLEELGDVVVVEDTGSAEGEGDAITGDCPVMRAEDASTAVPEARSEWPNEARMDPVRRGASEAARNSTLPRSQNSAFRSWRDGELEFQREHKNEKTPEEDPLNDDDDLDASGPWSDRGDNSTKLKKMSHLFVPTIQIMPNECDAEKQLPTMNYSLRGSELVEGGMELLSDTRYDADSRRTKTSKSPEIKINLRVRDDKKEPFGVAHLRPHNNNAPGLTRTDDSRCQALAAVLKGECSDKVPQFMVRDIRDNKGKLQTPIHQVRDVRKLVKSSYHFVSLDNNDTKSNLTTGGDCHVEQKKQGPYRNQASVSPIVIKCQSVNTNSNGKQSGNLIDSFKSGVNAESQCETDRFGRLSPEGAKGGSSSFHRPLEPPNKGDSFEGSLGLNIDTNSASTGRQEKASDNTDKKPETSANNQTAFSKLQAAVKTMEQLYVFDRNEWKRKSEPRPLTDGHLLSVMTSHEHGGEEEPDYNRPTPGKDGQAGRGFYPNAPSAFRDSPRSLGDSMLTRGEVRDVLKPFQHPTNYEDRLGFKPIPAQGGPAKNVCAFNVFGYKKPTENHGNARPSMPNPQPAKGFVPQSPKLPVSMRISQVEAKGKQHAFEAKSLQGGGRANLQDYLTMPLKSQTDGGKRVHTVQPSTSQDKAVYTSAPVPPRPQSPQKQYGPRAMETTITTAASTRSLEITPPAPPTLYSPFPLGMLPAQPQVFCFSPAMSPAPAALDPFQATQRKMLLDPTTGNYYLVDTPVQPATKRLLDPETGQYVDVPVPQQSMAPMTPMSMPQMALSPYMFYPGFMPGPLRTLAHQPQLMCMPQAAEMAADRGGDHHGFYMDNPYYVATGKSPLQQARTPLMSGGKTEPVISITSQQGPRIVAPPSFDGTTMSFVVEHR